MSPPFLTAWSQRPSEVSLTFLQRHAAAAGIRDPPARATAHLRHALAGGADIRTQAILDTRSSTPSRYTRS